MKNETSLLIGKMKDVINGDKHPNYDKMVQLAKDYNKWRTGEGLDADVRRLRKRESEEDLIQRNEITIQLLPRVISTIETTYTGKLRSNAINNIVESEDDKALAMINKAKALFYKYNSIDEILPSIYENMIFGDPNGWLLVPFYSVADGYKPYPKHLTSEMVINFEYVAGDLKFIIYKENGSYYLYSNEVYIKATETTKLTAQEIEDDFGKVVTGITNYEMKEKNYVIEYSEVYPYKETFAVQFGYIFSKNNFDIYNSPLEQMRPDIQRLINLCSERDINLLLHVFLQKYEYADPCNYPQCVKGYLPDNTKCPQCFGTGFNKTITTGLDTVKIPMPYNKEDLMDLSKLTHYTQLPIEVLKVQKEEIEDCIKAIEISAIGTDLFSRKELAEAVTATQVNSEQDKANNPLYRYVEKYCQVYQFAVEKIADIFELSDKVQVYYIIDKALFQKSVSQLIKDVSEAKGNVPIGFIVGMYDEIAEQKYVNSPTDLSRYNTRKLINYLFGYPQEQINLMTIKLGVDNGIIIRANFEDYILREMEARDEQILIKDDNVKLSLIEMIVTELKDKLKVEQIRFTETE